MAAIQTILVIVLANMFLHVRLSNDNLHSVEDQELGLILHQRIAPATNHLRNTVHGTNEDGDEGESRGADIELEARG